MPLPEKPAVDASSGMVPSCLLDMVHEPVGDELSTTHRRAAAKSNDAHLVRLLTLEPGGRRAAPEAKELGKPHRKPAVRRKMGQERVKIVGVGKSKGKLTGK